MNYDEVKTTPPVDGAPVEPPCPLIANIAQLCDCDQVLSSGLDGDEIRIVHDPLCERCGGRGYWLTKLHANEIDDAMLPALSIEQRCVVLAWRNAREYWELQCRHSR